MALSLRTGIPPDAWDEAGATAVFTALEMLTEEG